MRNFLICLFIIFVSFFAGNNICEGGISEPSKVILPKDKAKLEKIFFKTLYWEKYWFNEWGDKEFDRFVKKQRFHSLVIIENDKPNYVDVFVDDLKSIFSFSKTENGFMSISSQKDEVGYEDQKKTTSQLGKGKYFELTTQPEFKKVLEFGNFDDAKIKLVQKWFKKILDSDPDTFNFEKSTQWKNPKVIELKIGNFSKSYPPVYYYVKGIPYHGILEIEPKTGELVHDDLNYLGDEPSKEDLFLIKRIDESGKWFKLVNGELIPE